MTWIFVAITALGLAGTLIGEQQGRPFRFIAKPIASMGFIGLALALGATETRYGWWILTALVFGWIGDVALMGTTRAWFLTGLIAFLIGHLLYVGAFLVAGLALVPTTLAAAGTAVIAWLIFRWLRPHLPAEMVGPVVAYVVIISAMVATAVGATSAGAPGLVVVGAIAFFISDLAVARDRFVAPGFGNRVWGLPLYYLGQILLAGSIA